MQLSPHGQLITAKPNSKYYDNPQEKELLLASDMIKNRLFQANNYQQELTVIIGEIIAGKYNQHQLLQQIMPRAVTSWFGGLFELQTHLLGICYLIDNYISDGEKCLILNTTPKPELSQHNVLEWLRQQLNAAAKNIIIDECQLQELSLNTASGIIYLNHQTPIFNIAKLVKYINQLKSPEDTYFFRTQRVPADKNNKYLYRNRRNWKCSALSSYFLLNMNAAINSVSSKYFKTQFSSSLLVQRTDSDYAELGKNSAANVRLIDSTRDYLDELLLPIQEIGATNRTAITEGITFGHGLLLMITLMQYNKLNQIYALILSHDHVMAIAISQKQSMVKLLLYAPNNYHGYLSCYLKSPEITNREFADINQFNHKFSTLLTKLNALIKSYDEAKQEPHLEYLYYRQNQKLYLNFKCYVSRQSIKKNQQIEKLPNDFLGEFHNQLKNDINENKTHSTKTINAQLLENAIKISHVELINTIINSGISDYVYPQVYSDIRLYFPKDAAQIMKQLNHPKREMVDVR